MTTSDGYVGAKHKIVDHGPDSQRYNIVILGDGYQASELGQYATDVANFVATFRATQPYGSLWCGINIYRVDVVSTDSGADDPGTCGDGSTGTGATPRTYFDATYCGGGQIRRLLTCNSGVALSTAQAQVPEVHMTMVIVNASQYGGSGGSVATFSTNPSSAEIGLHEMGHTAFSFADEYGTYQGCGSGETGHDHYTGGEPTEPNVTANTNSATIKWHGVLTNAADTLPTTANANCSDCDPQANPRAASYVGAYDGARYFHCGCYRPSYNCRMRALGFAFCAVCQKVISDTLHPFLPAESITLTTPSIAFTDIPEGLGGAGVTTYRAIVFDVVTCGTRTFTITAGPTGGFGTPFGITSQVNATDPGPILNARIWLSYTSTATVSSASGSVTVACLETGQSWVINIMANTVPRPKSAVAMVLDHSGSMSDDPGDGTTKVAKLRQAAGIFVNAMLEGDGLAIVRFDDTAQLLMPVTDVGPAVTGAGRVAATTHINGPELDPAGSTSIGAGVVTGKAALDAAQAAASPHYDVTAMVVLTDGEENTPPFLADVGSSITANTFAIGFGQPENISTAALNTLTQGHNGYLLVTGAITSDQSTRLSKYFLQILAGITNANVVLDPQGILTAGAVHRIPFVIGDPDYGVDVFLLTPAPQIVTFELEAPNGDVLSPASVAALPNVQYVQASALAYYRAALPAEPAHPSGTHAGTWTARLSIDRKRVLPNVPSYAVGGAAAVARVPYNVIVHCYSNLAFRAFVQQTGFEPGQSAAIVATLREYDVPVDHRAVVWTEVTRPDGSAFVLTLSEDEPGRFTGTLDGTIAGLYRLRVRARGTTFRGDAFEREQTMTAAFYAGGNRPPKEGGCVDLCALLRCLVGGKGIEPAAHENLAKLGVNLGAIGACLAQQCAGSAAKR
jgi:hypothetical protein